MSDVLPCVGMSGVWPLKPPLENHLTPDAIYVCRAIRSINDYLAQNIDPYATIYQMLGIDQVNYDTDYANNAYIASLQAMDGTWEYIPVSYIQAYPNTSGVLYERKGLIITFPALPSAIDYQTFINNATILAGQTFGVDVESNLVPIGHQYILTSTEADLDYETRKIRMEVINTERVRIQVLETENIALKALLGQLTGCATSKCHSGKGMCFATFNEGTPGHTGYIDGADIKWCYPTDAIISDNAYDLYLYGQCNLPYGKRKSTAIKTTSRGGRFEAQPTNGLYYPNELQPNIVFPVTASDLLTVPPSQQEAIIDFVDFDQYVYDRYLRRSYQLSGSITHPELNTGIMDMIVKIMVPYQNRAVTSQDLMLKNIDFDQWQ